MAILSVETFLDCLRKSELTDKARLDAALEKIRKIDPAAASSDADWLGAELVKEGLITTWHVRQLMKRKYKGFFLRQYRILSHLGTGGMSTVYLAEHTLMQRRVAIKVLPKKRLAKSVYLERFVREAQAIASLDHPHIVRAYDIDRFEDIHYIVMEYFEGNNLRQLVEKEGQLPYEDAVSYIRQGAEGLMHAHRIGIIHRDVKPENLLANDAGLVKLLDLGLALLDETMFSQPQSSINEDKILGTADYLAPEQAIDSHAVDARADIYSLGCTLYFCLTGHAPFPFGTIPQRLLAHQRETPASIFADRPDAPADLVEICEKMMAKKPDDRYQTAAEVVQVLTRWLVKHGFAEARDFSGEPMINDEEKWPDDEFFNKELSYLKGDTDRTEKDTDNIPGGSGIFSGTGNEAAVNLFESAAGSFSGGSFSGFGYHSGSHSAVSDPKEFLLSGTSRGSFDTSGLDPLALALDEIKTGYTKHAGEPADSAKENNRPASDGKKGADPDTGRATSGIHSIHDTASASKSKGPVPAASHRLSPAREANWQTGTKPSSGSAEPLDKEQKKRMEMILGDWYRAVPFWFWAVFVAGYVLATFLAGILFALLMNLNAAN